jgi:hypothetical protein
MLCGFGLNRDFQIWSYDQQRILIDQFRILPELKKLATFDLFFQDENIALNNLNQLCKQPGAPSQLKELICFVNVQPIKISLYLLHLQQLQTVPLITLCLFGDLPNSDLPLTFQPFINSLDIQLKDIHRNLIQEIIAIKNLTSLSIYRCVITENLLDELILGIGSKLSNLHLDFSELPSPNMSFALFSICVNLEKLVIINLMSLGNDPDQIDMLKKCSKLKTLKLIKCDLQLISFSFILQQELSFSFPFLSSLTRVQIEL